MKRYTYLTLAALVFAGLAGLMLAGCSGTPSGTGTNAAAPAPATSSGTAAGGATIVEQNFAFSPSAITVKAGDTVTFKNQDTTTHEVMIDNKDLGKQAPGQDVTWTASADGTFPFSCIIHPSMTGQVTVGAGGGAAAPSGATSSGGTPPASTGGGSGYGY